MGVLVVGVTAAAARAQLTGLSAGEGSQPIGGEPVYGVPAWDPPVGGEPIYGAPVEEDAPIGGEALEPEASWDPPIGGEPIYPAPVEQEDEAVGDEPVY